MKPSFALTLSFDDVNLLHRSTYGWTKLAQIPLKIADIDSEMAHHLETSVRLDLHGVSTVLVIPESEVKCLKILIEDTPSEKFEDLIVSRLQNATPYPLNELVIDWIAEQDYILVAAVFRETLDQFENFAVKHKFNPLSYSSVLKGDFKNFTPFFGQTKFAENFLNGEQVEPETEPVFAKKSTSIQFRKRPVVAVLSKSNPVPKKADLVEVPVLNFGAIARFWEHANKVKSPLWRWAIPFALLLALILALLFLWVLASPNMSIKQLFTGSYSIDTALEEDESGLYEDFTYDLTSKQIFSPETSDEVPLDFDSMQVENPSSEPLEKELTFTENAETQHPWDFQDSTENSDLTLTDPLLTRSTEFRSPSPQPSAPQTVKEQKLDDSSSEIHVIEGKPAVTPGARPKGISVIAETYFNALQPKKRPDAELSEAIERLRYGGMLYETLASITPVKRPLSEQERQFFKLDDTSASEYAIAQSLIPAPRAANLKKQAERIIAERNKAQSVTAARASASLGQSATLRNALILDKASLIGVLGTNSKRHVLVRFPGGRIVKLSVGDRLLSGRVASIAETSMQYTKSGKTLTLRMPGI